MARSSKAKTLKNQRTIDVEAVGLLLLAVGVFSTALLIPQFPAGSFGRDFRLLLTSQLGAIAYALPLPLLLVGGAFFINRIPKGWGRKSLAYFVSLLGIWGLMMLFRPEMAGSWGLQLRSQLTGAAGLVFLPALFVLSLGIDLFLAWKPTSSARRFTQLMVVGIRYGYKQLMSWRRSLKEWAAFQADVALLRQQLSNLDKELLALETLLGSDEAIVNWRDDIALERQELREISPEQLKDSQRIIKDWQVTLQAYSRDRARDLRGLLQQEGLNDFDAWLSSMKYQLSDAVKEALVMAKPLSSIRHALGLELTAIKERYRKLSRQRDLALAQMQKLQPTGLLQQYEAHNARQADYQDVARLAARLEQELDYFEGWRQAAARLARLLEDYPGALPLLDVDEMLAAELRRQGRKCLPQIESWQQTLSDAENTVRYGGSSPDWPEPDTDYGEAMAVSDADFAAFEVDSPTETLPFDLGDVLLLDHDRQLSEDEDDLEEDDATIASVPEIGGIPIQLPTGELLDLPQRSIEDPALLNQESKARVFKINETLTNFKLEGRVVASVRGPTVTRFEVEPAPGEKISRFAMLSNDLALAMAVGSVRIEAPIPGKSVIGLEVPNASRDLITFREAAESPSFRRSKSRLPIVLGKSIDGEMVVRDLIKMPHILIAGSTGSGKSVAVNTLIGSLLFKYLPTELRLLMIDPKMVELTPYDGIPHLIRPVVTNPNDAAGVLQGAVAHMERRYKMMSKLGVKNLDQYNEKARNLDLPQMPFIIIVIDELADLMITSPKEVEGAIMRLAQMARATGMHLILATQRPSVDIITSLIKVNVPARMAFAVSSGHDSRTILDTMGAERLVGMGDMLYYQPGMVKPMRLQGPYISESEILQLANFLRRQYFDDEFVEAYGSDFDPPSMHESDASGLVDWNDDKLREAAELVVNEGQASVSRLQRRLMVGHARAGKLMDSLESLGIVGAHVGSKPREVLVDFDELPNIFGK